MGGSQIPKVPHYTQYKIAGNVKLEEMQNELAKHGLKDPWLRNEAWRATFWEHPTRLTIRILSTGFKPAACLVGLVLFFDYGLGIGRASVDKAFHEAHHAHHDH